MTRENELEKILTFPSFSYAYNLHFIPSKCKFHSTHFHHPTNYIIFLHQETPPPLPPTYHCQSSTGETYPTNCGNKLVQILMLLWSEDWIRTLYATSFNSLIPRRFFFCSNEWWNTLASRVELEFPCAVLWEVWSVFSDKQQETTEWISKSNIFFLSTSLIILKKIKSKQESWSIPPSPFLYPSSLLSFFNPSSSRPSQYTDTAKQTVRLKYLRIFFNHFHILQIINI